MVRDANSAREVVNRVRALFRQSEPATIAVDLNEVIEEVRRLVLDEVAGRSVSIETDLQQDLPRVLADRPQIQQVLVNLVRNGIEPMETTTDAPRLLLIRSKSEGADYARVEVSDRGGGLRDPASAFKPSSPPRRRAWEWDWRFAARSLWPTRGNCRQRGTKPPGQPSAFSCWSPLTDLHVRIRRCLFRRALPRPSRGRTRRSSERCRSSFSVDPVV